MLIGRSEEISWLQFCADEAARGKPRVAILEGDPGVGKSRILKSELALAREFDAAVGLGRGYQDAGIPYLPIVELLRSLEDDLRLAGRAVAPERSPAEALGLWQEATDADGGERHRARLFLELSARLIDLATDQLLLLAIDDLHWLDDSSLALLSHLVFAISDAAERGTLRVLLIVTTRPFEEESTASRTLARLLREPLCESLSLSGLDPISTRSLLAESGIPHASAQLVASVQEVTDGNPLFIETVSAELLQSDAIETVGGDAVSKVALEELPIAEDLGIAIAARISKLPDAERRTLEYASLLGTRFAPARLAAVLEISVATLHERLTNYGEIVQSSHEHFEFAHPLIRQELQRRMQRAQRQERHAQIAQVLARQADASAWDTARHLMASGPYGDREALRETANLAGNEAFRMCAWQEAGEAYAAAAEVAESQVERAQLHYQAGRSFLRNYDHGMRRRHFRRALEDFEANGDAVSAARALAESSRADLFELPLGELRDMKPFERALEQLPEDAASERGGLYARMADSNFYASRSTAGHDYAQRALACGVDAGDDELCADASVSLAMAEQQGLHYRTALSHYGNALEYASSGDAWVESGLRVRAASARFMLGGIQRSCREWALAIETAERLNDLAEKAFANAYIAGAQAALGDFAEAEMSVEYALRLASRVESRPWVPIVVVPTIAYIRFLQGSFSAAADALAALNEPGRLVDTVGPTVYRTTRCYRALIAAASGDILEDNTESTRDMLKRYASRTRPETADGMGLGLVCSLIELADLLGMPGAVEGPTRVLEVAYQQGAVLATGWPALIPRVLGLSSMLRREYDAAEVLFEEARRVAEHAGALPELARTQLEEARCLVEAGGSERESRARDLLEQACALSARLGMEPTLRRATALAPGVGLQLPQREPGSGLNHRDHALIERIARGHSDGRIATDLLLSPETLRRQLTDLFGRLGVDDRKDALGYAAHRGLLPEPERGIPVTLMVTDIENFTPQIKQLGDALAKARIQAHNRTLRAAIRDHSGIEVTHTGDGVIASFRSSVEALGCAVAIQQAFGADRSDGALRLRIGLHAGAPLPEEGRLFGLDLVTTVRVCNLCTGGEILVSDSVRAEARHYSDRLEFAGNHTLKGMPGEIPLYRVEWREAPEGGS